MNNRTNQPRTVHIDVYCTGSDASTNTEDNTSSDEKSSTPETVYDSKQYKIFHQQKKHELPFHLNSKSSSSNPKMVSDVIRSQIKVDSKNVNHPVAFAAPTNLATNTEREKVFKKTPQELFGQQQQLREKHLMKMSSEDTVYTMSSKYPSTHGVSRDTTYSSVESSDWSYMAATSKKGTSHSSWKESGQSKSSFVKSDSFEYEDSLDNAFLAKPVTEALQQFEKDSHEDKWWMNYVFDHLDDKGAFFNVISSC